MPKKIEKFASDAAAFYLHKNRNFLQKLEEQAKERLANEEEDKILLA